LKDFKFGRCGLVNQFLIDNDLADDMRVVLAQYDYTKRQPWENEAKTHTERCIGLEVINEKRMFYYTLKGHANLQQQIKNYETQHG